MCVCGSPRAQQHLVSRLTRTAPAAIARFSSATDAPYYDVVIAGGGVVGFSTAYHLAATSNLSVAVVERDCSVGAASDERC
jgi:ribulose 1,5-bisphosphate synthetase/thiazole synthase